MSKKQRKKRKFKKKPKLPKGQRVVAQMSAKDWAHLMRTLRNLGDDAVEEFLRVNSGL